VVAETLEILGGLDVVVNNAGVAIDAPVLGTSDEVWRSTLAVNLDAAFEVAQAAARRMVEHGGGAIVNVASIDAIVPEAPLLAYNVSKAGLVALTRTFALELGHLGVRVNAVAPGETLTPMTEEDLGDPVFRREYLAGIPAQRAATPEEVVGPILFLASEEASYVNGATLVVDGGAIAGSWYYPSQRPSQRPSLPPEVPEVRS
jgi:NAD(P)-dependent dehydrogenase (short-subunit alcohol dehydrogenase family)